MASNDDVLILTDLGIGGKLAGANGRRRDALESEAFAKSSIWKVCSGRQSITGNKRHVIIIMLS